MTPEEKNEYEKLTTDNKKIYDLYKGMHPDWSHSQLMCMIVTGTQDTSEKKDYKKLTKEGKKFYDLYQGMHPDWTHAQLVTMATICEKAGNGPNTTLKDILSECVRKADHYLKENFPNLYPAVKELFCSIGSAIKKAAQVTWDFLVSLVSNF